ncbi:zinc-dependent alcohol dehydrogenase family protein [Candidatus Parabeggiatoa sp. HSG14]|uniref:zinc-dependent alcohol dehydrogenase family protein n=1 Tax=Candidatus Parabeggiatoa sp. HSG14 TaxID=3055593 RepID=UPI0025A79DCF|nr:zinc-dependent alcohol dehydrogenase family protein [Thiotrichales bacterium HSG14]
MMKAVLLTAAGGTEVLKMDEVNLSTLPNTDFMRVRLYAAGINPVDYKMRDKGGMMPDKLPTILGCDGAGVVDAIGETVTRFKVGDEVYFFNGGIGTDEQGNYAEHTLIHQDYAALKPKKLSMSDAAAIPLAWITAWESLVDRAQLQANQTVLIHAGVGGVGHLAIQLAKSLGARVAVTVSNEEKAKLAQSLGADYCINYTQTDFVQATLDWTNGMGADVIFDTVGGDIFCQSIAATKIYGKVVTILEKSCDENAIKMAKLRNLSLIFELMLTPMLYKMHEARVAQRMMIDKATRLIEEGKLQVKVSQTLPLAQVAEAHRLIEVGHTVGKIVLTINEHPK